MDTSIEDLMKIVAEAESDVATRQEELEAAKALEVPDKEDVKTSKANLKTAKEALKTAKEALKTAKANERKAEKERQAAEREANKMPEQNGIRRPKPDGKCGQTWAHADALSAKFGYPTPIADLLEVCNGEGLNSSNTKAEYARWRKFNNITGRVTHPIEETEAPAES